MKASRPALAALALIVLTPSADGQTLEEAQQTLVIEGVERDTAALRELRQEFDATRVQLPGRDELEVWQAPAARIEELRQRVQEESQGVLRPRITQMEYNTILAPAPPGALTAEQRATVAAIAQSAGATPPILQANDDALVRQALTTGFNSGGLLSRRRSFFADFGGAPEGTVEFRQNRETEPEWSGQLDVRGFATLRIANGELSGEISRGNTYVELRSLGDNLYAAIETTDIELVDDETNTPEATGLRPPGDGRATATIDVLVLYTQAAQATGGNIRLNFGSGRIDALNATIRSAEIDSKLRFRLVGLRDVDYAEANQPHDAHIVNLTGDGALNANAIRHRDSHNADIVALIVSVPSDANALWCGEAGSIGPARERAFVVVNQLCLGQHSFEHEIGHLFGLRHSIEEDPKSRPYAYGHGFPMPDLYQRTIMARRPGCPRCTRIPRWSNPDQTWGGMRLGTYELEDEARVLRENAAEIAAFY